MCDYVKTDWRDYRKQLLGKAKQYSLRAHTIETEKRGDWPLSVFPNHFPWVLKYSFMGDVGIVCVRVTPGIVASLFCTKVIARSFSLLSNQTQLSHSPNKFAM